MCVCIYIYIYIYIYMLALALSFCQMKLDFLHDGTCIRVFIAKHRCKFFICCVGARKCLNHILHISCRCFLIIGLSSIRISHQVVWDIWPKLSPLSCALHFLQDLVWLNIPADCHPALLSVHFYWFNTWNWKRKT